MKTKINLITLNIPSARMNGSSSLPALSQLNFWHRNGNTALPEEDGLFVGYGHVPSPFPYRMQDKYTRELYDTETPAVVLENENLRATFLPTWGGKLQSLFDKRAGRELLSVNPVMRPCNLAIRNAWTSGGIEWNCGIFGHNVHTCDTMFTTTTSLSDGTPVLRMYEFERIRQAVWQMDFFLPEGSEMLYCRMRITNPLYEVVPMYWWSNAAAPETPGCRVIVNADGAYVQENNISLVSIPEHDGFDGTRPDDIPNAMDHFYKVPERARKWEAQVGADGYGILQTSTSRLRGRKLFAWGQGPGGDRWQEYLTVDGSDSRYTEIQAGLACSQYEYVPMPPKTAWEWIEAYGAVSAEPEIALGDDWQAAKAHVAGKLDEKITEDALEQMLEDTRAMAKAPAQGELLFRGSGWAALENMRRDRVGQERITPHLDFGSASDEQADWISLMENGTMGSHKPDDVPSSWMLQREFVDMLKKAAEEGDRENWYTHLQLGAALCASNKLQEAYDSFKISYDLEKNPWALFGMSQISRLCGVDKTAAETAMSASLLKPSDESLAKEAMALLISAELYEKALELASALTDEVRAVGRIRLYVTIADIHTGKLEEAERVLWESGGLVVADIREGENIITNIYLDLEEAKARRDGLPFDRASAEVPAVFDYRVSQRRKKKKAEGAPVL